MSKTQAEKQRDYRARQKVKSNAPMVTVTPVTVTVTAESNAPTYADVLAPLDVYSPGRWAYLQGRRYEWNQDKQRGVKSYGVIGVVVPGDPAYGEVVGGQCRTCEGEVQQVVKCIKCCAAGTPSPPQAKPHTFADLPSDVQASITKHCAENNNGQRAGSHSRAAMTERSLSYQAMRPDQGAVI